MQALLRQVLAEPAVVHGRTEQLSQLRLLVLKQLGALLSSTNREQALSFYCQAADLGARDSVLYNRLATLVRGGGC